ncbi:hypothetical protein GCM10027446_18710 [Angustibacter peucedani]
MTDEHLLTGAAQTAAMRHPLRHRISLAMGTEPWSVSALARQLDVNKGNVAHHLQVLLSAGLVERAGTRTGRGGTQQLYRRVASSLRMPDDAAITDAMFATMASAVHADPHAMAYLRDLRLTAEQAQHLAVHLDTLVGSLPAARREAPTYSVLVAVARSGRPGEPGGRP